MFAKILTSMSIINRPIILASKSPRRSQIMADAGIEFTVKTREIEESYPDTLELRFVPEFLAKKKAAGVKDFIKGEEILVTSDTIVIMNDTIYGKPKDREDAIKILTELSGGMHEVITGVSLMSKDKQITFSDVTEVYIDPISQEEIVHYVDNFKPFDKAGAYAIQEWLGLAKIGRINGSYYNVVGLPISKVYHALSNWESL